MNTNQIKALALKVLAQYNLDVQGWTVTMSNHAKRRAGSCHYGTREIRLSVQILTNAPESEVRETILHEVAHALTPGHSHDHVWKQKLISMGGTGRRTHKMETVKGRYDMVCANCGVVGNRHQKTGQWKYATATRSPYNHRTCGGMVWLRDTKAPHVNEEPVIRLLMPAPTARRVPVAASTPTPKSGPACRCECGGTTKGGNYLPGHDARHVSEVFGRWLKSELDYTAAVAIFAHSAALATKIDKRIAAHAAKNYK